MSFLKEVKTLIKFRIALLSTMSAATGFIIAYKGFSLSLVLFIAGLFMLAGGSAALNQYQERALDGLMDRTRSRPLPAGRLSSTTGLAIALILIAAGLAVLFFGFGPLPALLGTVTVVLYNGMYTYLKRISAFAAVPGALIGALPPAIGWLAAGGEPGSPVLLILVLFFYIWQVPHFWLLLGIRPGDYAKAGFPALTDVFTSSQLARVTFTWVAATACAGLLFPLFGMFNHAVSPLLVTGLVVWLASQAIPLVKERFSTPSVFRRVFMYINMFALLMMVILIIDHGVLLWIF
jgi:protoheme IX farnesyltransferase